MRERPRRTPPLRLDKCPDFGVVTREVAVEAVDAPPTPLPAPKPSAPTPPPARPAVAATLAPATHAPIPTFPDDRDQAPSDERCVLVIEDEPKFAQILYDLAHELGYRCLVAHGADEGFHLRLVG